MDLHTRIHLRHYWGIEGRGCAGTLQNTQARHGDVKNYRDKQNAWATHRLLQETKPVHSPIKVPFCDAPRHPQFFGNQVDKSSHVDRRNRDFRDRASVGMWDQERRVVIRPKHIIVDSTLCGEAAIIGIKAKEPRHKPFPERLPFQHEPHINDQIPALSEHPQNKYNRIHARRDAVTNQSAEG